MTGEYRVKKAREPRHAPPRAQIQAYHRRLVLLNRASWLGAVALLCFLAAALAGGPAMAYPPVRAIKAVGSGNLLLGLLLIAAAVLLELIESGLARHEIDDEIADLDDEAKRWAL